MVMLSHGFFKFRLIMIAIALLMCAIAVTLWLNDGAWHYAAMPTKGVIRTALFGGAGCLCLFISGKISNSRE
ncbi:MAG: hypothetical protein HQ501_03255 [Rhodospirillales bacterium]|nr:hypothetical protein [Rhodospirillales bacterium]